MVEKRGRIKGWKGWVNELGVENRVGERGEGWEKEGRAMDGK